MRSLTPRIVLELLAHEGIVPEAYRDSQGIWTWSIGITNASGHQVYPRYRDKPQPMEHCLGVFLWLLRERYLPPVLATFGQHELAEHELAAALSFHYNTGAIARADWCRRFLAGDRDGAAKAFLNWSRPAEIIPRRKRERDLFFDGTWSADGTAMLYAVSKPRYRPCRGKRVDIAEAVTRLFLDSEPAKAEQVRPETPEPHASAPCERRASWFDWLFGGAPLGHGPADA
jgi:lysozyme